MVALSVLVVVVLLALLLASASIRLVQQYERGVVLRFGRLLPGLRQPGLQLIGLPPADARSDDDLSAQRRTV